MSPKSRIHVNKTAYKVDVTENQSDNIQSRVGAWMFCAAGNDKPSVEISSGTFREMEDQGGYEQGGNISPVVFSIYTDYILHGLKSNGLGCHVGAVFAGALAYADDIILLSPSRSALDDMLDNAAMLSGDLNLKFNNY